jgi:hypothetical protein
VGVPTEWRGEILHVDSGRISSFEDWPEMVDVIAEALHSLRPKLTAVTGSDPTAE